MTRVVAAVIRRGDAVLVARRPEGKRHGGKWEFPGGKVRDGETDRDAIARELLEELALELESVEGEIASVADPGSPFRIHFLMVRTQGEPRAVEHAELRWCEVGRLGELDLAPADRQFARGFAGPPTPS